VTFHRLQRRKKTNEEKIIHIYLNHIPYIPSRAEGKEDLPSNN
jgi:predicted RNA-binding protein Jag